MNESKLDEILDECLVPSEDGVSLRGREWLRNYLLEVETQVREPILPRKIGKVIPSIEASKIRDNILNSIFDGDELVCGEFIKYTKTFIARDKYPLQFLYKLSYSSGVDELCYLYTKLIAETFGYQLCIESLQKLCSFPNLTTPQRTRLSKGLMFIYMSLDWTYKTRGITFF